MTGTYFSCWSDPEHCACPSDWHVRGKWWVKHLFIILAKNLYLLKCSLNSLSSTEPLKMVSKTVIHFPLKFYPRICISRNVHWSVLSLQNTLDNRHRFFLLLTIL